MRCLILFVMLKLIVSGSVQSEDIPSDRRPARCRNPLGKPGQTLVKSCSDKDVCTLGKNNKATWQTCPVGLSQDVLKAFEADVKVNLGKIESDIADVKADVTEVISKLNDTEVNLKDLFKQHLEIISLLHDIIGLIQSTTTAGPVWRKVYSLNTAGGLFANLDEAQKKNIDDPDADLFSILYDLESMRNKEGVYHFKICYPELTSEEFPCNDWIQSSNPVTEQTITGYAGITLTWDTNGYGGPFQGLGLSPPSSDYNLIDSAPFSRDDNWWWFSIGSITYNGTDTVPGPPPNNIKIVEFSVLYTPSG